MNLWILFWSKPPHYLFLFSGLFTVFSFWWLRGCLGVFDSGAHLLAISTYLFFLSSNPDIWQFGPLGESWHSYLSYLISPTLYLDRFSYSVLWLVDPLLGQISLCLSVWLLHSPPGFLDVRFRSICCEYHWLIEKLFSVYCSAEYGKVGISNG